MIRSLLILTACLGVVRSVAASAQTAPSEGPIVVTGWPLPSLAGQAPDLELGDDPVIGRQACPALTRLNLAAKRSEDLLVRRAVEEFRDPARGALWRFELRQGIFWWSGDAVKADDVAGFLRARLAEVVAERGAGLWELPEHKVSVDADGSVTVAWKKPPVFGPYVLSGVPLSRARAGGSFAFECAGLYRIEPRPFGIALTPTPGYKSRRPLAELHLYRGAARQTDRDPPPRSLGFRFASEFGGTPWTRISDDAAPCKTMLEVPFATMIVWNPKRGPASDPRFRALMTQLMPRGALVRSAAASMGELVSAPIPRAHPGYGADVAVRSFDLDAVSKGLADLGYRRKTAESPRLTPAGEPLRLVIRAPDESTGLPEKVIADAFSAVGIGVQLVGEATDPAAADGSLSALSLDWPRADFLGNFHSGVAAQPPFWPLADRDLDQRLEAYAASLTTAVPAFATLTEIHRRLYELEPASIVLQHKVCVDAGHALRLTKTPDPRDPDWFRQLVL